MRKPTVGRNAKQIITWKRREHIVKSLGREAAEIRVKYTAVLQPSKHTYINIHTMISRKNCFPFTSRFFSFHSFSSSSLFDMIKINQWNEQRQKQQISAVKQSIC